MTYFFTKLSGHTALTVSYPIKKFSQVILGYAVFKHSDLLEKLMDQSDCLSVEFVYWLSPYERFYYIFNFADTGKKLFFS